MSTVPATRYTITFRGRVQGVGFRATACRVAEGYQVTGWVMNVRDGSVCCVAEGSRAELDRFVSAIQGAMDRHIFETTIADSEATGEFEHFSIAY
jgi:acylphosphatase